MEKSDVGLSQMHVLAWVTPLRSVRLCAPL